MSAQANSLGKAKKPKKLSRGQIVKKLDSAYSQYIRVKDAVGGDATCVTCGVTKHWKELQNGHFYTRGRYATRWDDDNCHVQCMRCNVMLKGNYIAYTKYMINRYGMDFVDELEIKSLTTYKISTVELVEKIELYKQKVTELQLANKSIVIDTSTEWGYVV